MPSADTVMSVSQSLLGNSSIDIRAAQHGDEQLSPIITALSTNSSPPHNIAPGLKQCFLENGLLCCKFHGSSNTDHTQLFLPNILRFSIFQKLHNELGHLGLHKTMERVKQRYYCIGRDMRQIYRILLVGI